MPADSHEAVIGLEVHAQLLTRSKLFCGCATESGAPPNSHVCPVCLGLPGALPVPNRAALEMAVRAGLALGCRVHPSSRFARKNYFYPDLAKGYQISQLDDPVNEGGTIAFELEDGQRREVTLVRAHLEEDAAKSAHDAAGTLVDFNRAGVPLLEIVSAPELRSAQEAEAYLRRLREILVFLGVNDGNLEEGSFRCDANVSIRPAGSALLGARVELKNINSFRFVRRALEHEIARQRSVVAGGGAVVQETRTYDEAGDRTVPMRGKEEAEDYRYFPDPDLPPVELGRADIDALAASQPELPEAIRARFQAELGLTAYDARVLTTHPGVARYFEQVAGDLAARLGPEGRSDAGKMTANFVQVEVLRHAETDGLAARFPVPADALAELLSLVAGGTLSHKLAKDVLGRMMASGERAAAIVEREGLAQVNDESAITEAVRAVLAAHPEQVAAYRGGQTKLLGFFVGQVMKATRGRANPARVNQVLKELLSG